VHELNITIAPDRFQAMQEDLRALIPNFPGGLGRGDPFPGAMLDAQLGGSGGNL
jgi:hypothetical protein